MMQGKITAIEAQKRQRSRVNIHLDGAYAFSLDRLTAAWLQLGQELSADAVQKLQASDELEAAHARALNLLSYRARSQHEVEQFLQQKGYTPALSGQVLERLKEQGYLDDLRFAREWIENRNTFRPRSKRALRVELMRKGLENATIEAALEQSLPDDSASLLQAGLKLGKRYRGLPREEFQRKLAAALLRRGFAYAEVRETLPDLWSQLAPDSNTDTL